MTYEADVVVVGAGLAGLVATAELADAGKRVLVVDQEPESSLGGQAHWSFGGLFLVDTPEQRRLGVRDSADAALQDWMASAEFGDGPNDHWGRQWAEAYVDAAAYDLYPWLKDQGIRFFPAIQWVERGGYFADGPGSSVPRFHIVWGTGPGILEPFIRRVREAEARGLVDFRFRHRVTELSTTDGRIDGCAGTVLAPADGHERGFPTNRDTTGEFEARGDAVVIATGGIGGNHDMVRRYWPDDWPEPPADLIQGVPDYVDGSGWELGEKAGANITNTDRMWNYPEGIPHHTPRWSKHAVRIINGPSTLWLDATGKRLPPPLFPLFDTMKAYEHIARSGHDHSWYLCNHRIVTDEFSLSGSAHNPDLTERSLKLLARRALPKPFDPVETFMDSVPDFVRADKLSDLVRKMNDLTGQGLVDEDLVRRQVVAYDRQVASGYHNDAQLAAIGSARRFRLDRIFRTTSNPRILDEDGKPLVAVRLRILTRKSLGGLQTDLATRVLRPDGDPLPGLYAVGEVAGFGGGGYHGRRSMEGTFLGGCLFTGRTAGRHLAATVG